MTFPEALAAVLAGSIISRNAWHGEIFIYLEKPEQAPVDADHPLSAAYPDNTKLAYHAYVAQKAHGGVIPWTPGQQDIFADDWGVIAV